MFQRYSKQIKILSERHLNPELLGVSSETKTIKIRRKEEKEKKNHRAVFTVDRYPPQARKKLELCSQDTDTHPKVVALINSTKKLFYSPMFCAVTNIIMNV